MVLRVAIVLLASLLFLGCSPRVVTEYVYVPERIEVPVYRPDTTAFSVYREFVDIIVSDTSAFDTLTVDGPSERIRAAVYEGQKLRAFRQAVYAFFMAELNRY